MVTAPCHFVDLRGKGKNAISRHARKMCQSKRLSCFRAVTFRPRQANFKRCIVETLHVFVALFRQRSVVASLGGAKFCRFRIFIPQGKHKKDETLNLSYHCILTRPHKYTTSHFIRFSVLDTHSHKKKDTIVNSHYQRFSMLLIYNICMAAHAKSEG